MAQGLRVVLRDSNDGRIPMYENHNVKFHPYLQAASICTALISREAYENVKVLLTIDDRFQLFAAQGVKVVLACGYGDAITEAECSRQAWWIPIERIHGQHFLAFDALSEGVPTRGVKAPWVHMPEPEELLESTGFYRSATVWQKNSTAAAGSISVFVFRGKLGATERNVRKGSGPRFHSSLHNFYGKTSDFVWFQPLRGRRGSPNIFEFRNIPADDADRHEKQLVEVGSEVSDYPDDLEQFYTTAEGSVEADDSDEDLWYQDEHENEHSTADSKQDLDSESDITIPVRKRARRTSARLARDQESTRLCTYAGVGANERRARRACAIRNAPYPGLEEDDDEELPAKHDPADGTAGKAPPQSIVRLAVSRPSPSHYFRAAVPPTPETDPSDACKAATRVPAIVPPMARHPRAPPATYVDLTAEDERTMQAMKCEVATTPSKPAEVVPLASVAAEEEDEVDLQLQLEEIGVKRKLRAIEKKKAVLAGGT